MGQVVSISRENIAENPYLFFASTKAAEVKQTRKIKIGQSATLFASGAVMAVAPIHGYGAVASAVPNPVIVAIDIALATALVFGAVLDRRGTWDKAVKNK